MTVLIEKVPAKDIDGIEFYCSTDGERTGMSQVGLARFCGLPRISVWRLIESIVLPGSKKIPESLKELALVDIYHENLLGSSRGGSAQIIKAEICAEICAWAAYEHNGGNKVARFSLKKFAACGIKNFIQEVTGFKTLAPESNTDELLKKLIDKVDQMDVRLERTEGYLKARVEYPGLKDWMEAIEVDANQFLLEGEQQLYTLNEAIAEIYHGMVLTKAHKTGLSRSISEVYKAMKLDPPVQVVRPNKVGYNSPPVNAFPSTMFPIIKACYSRLVQL
jgi:hypothetical protein